MRHATTVVCLQEQMAGWFAEIHRARKADGLLYAYENLLNAYEGFLQFEVWPYDRPAHRLFEAIRPQLRRLGVMDLRIAAIVLTRRGTLLTRNLRDLSPVHPGRVGMYVCGLTVQGPPHIGHLRAVVVGDVMRRYLTHRGYDVTLIHNFTDVEDKIIAKAAEEGVDFRVVAERNIAAYSAASLQLGALEPTVAPRVTDPTIPPPSPVGFTERSR